MESDNINVDWITPLRFLRTDGSENDSVTHHLATFANSLPIFFRAPTLLALVWILWGVNVYAFNKFNIDYAELMNLKSNPSSVLLKPADIWLSGFCIIGLVILLFFASSALYLPLDAVLVLHSFVYFMALMLFVMPLDRLYRPGRDHLLHNIYKVFMPLSSGVLFVEVLLGDVMTSVSKVMADVGVTMCIFFNYYFHSSSSNSPENFNPHLSVDLATHEKSSYHDQAYLKIVGGNSDIADVIMTNFQDCTGSWSRPFLTSIPFLLRFRQCWVQYKATGEEKNLLNCLKYFSSLPVIWVSAFSHHYPKAASDHLQTAWMVAVTFNSFYSFMWDVIMDWGLCMNNSKHFLLRNHLVYNMVPIQPNLKDGDSREKSQNRDAGTHCKKAFSPGFYYVAIVVDFLLRILWSFKLSVHFQLSREGFTFFLEVCEVFRRFLWLFLRVEWEFVNNYEIVGQDDEGDYELVRKQSSSESEPQEKVVNIPYTPSLKQSSSGLSLNMETNSSAEMNPHIRSRSVEMHNRKL